MLVQDSVERKLVQAMPLSRHEERGYNCKEERLALGGRRTVHSSRWEG